jgi:glycosyltransferase involved in cell wall biosynthesis
MTADRPITVLQMLPALNSGGVERGTLEVGRHLVTHGHRSLVMSAGGRMVRQLECEGSHHYGWEVGRKSLWSLRLVRPLRRLLLEQQVDILHLRSRMPAWIGYLAWRGMDPARRPHLVTTVHGPYSVNRYGAVMTRGERVIVISEMIRDYVLRNYPATDAGKLRLIPRGVDPAAYPRGYTPPTDWLERWYREFPHTRGKRLLTLPARVTRWKGQDDFIGLMARLCSQRADCHGLIVGDADPRRQGYFDGLRAKVGQLGLDDRISFAGHRGDLREIMAISDLVLSLSREPEAFGRVTLEALSLGRPVIAYDHGGVHEQLAAMLPEGAVPVGDVVAAADKALAWLQQPPGVDAANPFTLERMLRATLDVYEELVLGQD